MIDVSNKVFGMFAIAIIASMQLYAWHSGFNGTIFAFTSLCIGGIIGAVYRIKIGTGGK